MRCSSTRQANMNKENTAAKVKDSIGRVTRVKDSIGRVTRARAKALTTFDGNDHSKPPLKGPINVSGAKFKKPAPDESKISAPTTTVIQRKRRAILRDVTNSFCESSHATCINTSTIKINESTVRGPAKFHAKLPFGVSINVPKASDDSKTKLTEDLSKIRKVEMEEIPLLARYEEGNILQNTCPCICGVSDMAFPKSVGLQRFQNKEENFPRNKIESSNHIYIMDIDSSSKDPQDCCIYASDICKMMRVTELDHRPTNYMEQLQRDITVDMRGILIDWLVEVSEEYKLVLDTLYLTANIIDRYLSKSYIEKQKLQLLGVTCLLIASKYEEICSPMVEEFCFITDNTCTKGQVLEMESEVLNLIHFKLSVPTAKTFLRRFIQVAKTESKIPRVELEYLADYLAELTLVDYNFLKFLPSLIAASAVFLAKWTLNQSNHPWSPILVHYTTYNTSELKTTVLALENLQLNTDGSSLNAIREKYGQQKFKCVATIISAHTVQTLF